MSLRPVARWLLSATNQSSVLSGRGLPLLSCKGAQVPTGGSLGLAKVSSYALKGFKVGDGLANSKTRLLPLTGFCGAALPPTGSLSTLSQLSSNLLKPSPLLLNSTRSVTKFSLRKGRRKTLKAVIKRFYRLDWGGWISTKQGRFRHLWKKPIKTRARLRHHVFRLPRECKDLDRGMTKYWIKKKWFVDDPYENYHHRDNFRQLKGIYGLNSIKIGLKNRNYPQQSSMISKFDRIKH